jgi:hypothetical protein
MKLLTLLAATMITLASAPLVAQAAAVNTQAGSSATAAANPSNQAHPDIDYAHMQPVNGVLDRNLDVKSARVGQQVTVKVTKNAQIAGGIVIPKGSQLQGHVTKVQASTKSQKGSLVGIEFDRAVPKDGQPFAIHSIIQSLSLPASVIGEERTRGWGLSGPGPAGPSYGGKPMGGTATAGTAMAGHGLVGDAVLTADANGGQMHSSFDESATGLPDVMLSGDPTGSSSGVLSAEKKNFRLDSGTVIVVGVIAAGK